MHLDKVSFVRLTWLLVTAVIFGGGVGGIWWPASQSIEEVRSHARELYEQANQNDAIVRRAIDLHAAETRIHADVVALGGERSAGAVTAAMLRLFNDESRKLNVDVRTFTPVAAPSTPRSAQYAMSGTDVSVGLRGPFRNVVNLIADLPRHDVLIEIHDAQLSSIDMVARTPMLDVTLNATIYRITQKGQQQYVRAL